MNLIYGFASVYLPCSHCFKNAYSDKYFFPQFHAVLFVTSLIVVWKILQNTQYRASFRLSLQMVCYGALTRDADTARETLISGVLSGDFC